MEVTLVRHRRWAITGVVLLLLAITSLGVGHCVSSLNPLHLYVRIAHHRLTTWRKPTLPQPHLSHKHYHHAHPDSPPEALPSQHPQSRAPRHSKPSDTSFLIPLGILATAVLAMTRAVRFTLYPPEPRIAMFQFGKFERTKEEIEEEEFVDDEDETYMGYFPPSPDDTDEENDAEMVVEKVREEYIGEEYRLKEYVPAMSMPAETLGEEYKTIMAQWPPPNVLAFGSHRTKATASPNAIQTNVQKVQNRLMDACQTSRVMMLPTLVASSSGYGPSAIRAAYAVGQRIFAENRLNELLRKCKALPPDIAWHYTGPIVELNDIMPLIQGCPNLMVVECVDSQQVADMLSRTVIATRRRRLKVYLHINFLKQMPYRAPPAKLLWAMKKKDREAEVEKARNSWYTENLREGLAAGLELPLAQHIVQACPGLELAGLMTNGIGGMLTRSQYQQMVFSRRRIAQSLALDESALQLSMGNGADLEAAIANGATSVRVAYEIFGPRPSIPEL